MQIRNNRGPRTDALGNLDSIVVWTEYEPFQICLIDSQLYRFVCVYKSNHHTTPCQKLWIYLGISREFQDILSLICNLNPKKCTRSDGISSQTLLLCDNSVVL